MERGRDEVARVGDAWGDGVVRWHAMRV